MGERLFDDLARSLARPMPRRRALRLLGAMLAGALASGGPGGVWSRSASAGMPARRDDDFCRQGTKLCTTTPNCIAEGTTCAPAECCDEYRPVCCATATAAICCPKGLRCGRPGEGKGACVLEQKCPSSRRKCGSRCCPKGAFCCDPKRKLCCRKGGVCCNTAPPGKPTKWSCCPKGASCAPELELTPTGMTAGVPKNAPRICCPKERVVPLQREVCCPPGHVSLGGKLILPAGGGGGLCCRKDKLCGAGTERTCCSSGTATVPELEQTCCNGTCVSTRFDARNCGACGRACAAGERCRNGTCVAA